MAPLMLDIPARIPVWVRDHDSFRRWARSDGFPEKGWISYFAGEIWVDLSVERLAHNRIKTQIAAVLTLLGQQEAIGMFLGDRMMLSNLDVGLSTEPDGMFLSNEALAGGRAKLERGDESVEVVGTPDMVLEVVSPSSVEKDTVVLRQLYWEAGVPEYWLVDSREEEPRLEILKRGGTRYTAVRGRGGWVKSGVFGKEFRLMRRDTGHGVSEFTLEAR